MKMGETLGEAAREPLTAMGPQPPRKTSSAGAERHLRGLFDEGVPAEMSMGMASPLSAALGDGRASIGGVGPWVLENSVGHPCPAASRALAGAFAPVRCSLTAIRVLRS